MATHSINVTASITTRWRRFLDLLNGPWHERSLQIFMAIVLAHWGEHLFQAYQVYYLEWPIPESLGMLGLYFPWLVSSEILHYGYALVMIAGIWWLRESFTGRARFWWMVAFWIQFWHHIEHLALQYQAAAGWNFFGSPVPMSFAQYWIPRVELHLIYNTAVFIPMVVGMYYHMFPETEEEVAHGCTCMVRPPSTAAT